MCIAGVNRDAQTIDALVLKKTFTAQMCRCEGCANRSGSADKDSENKAEDYNINHEDESDNDYGDN
jgi:hypothetical protein